MSGKIEKIGEYEIHKKKNTYAIYRNNLFCAECGNLDKARHLINKLGELKYDLKKIKKQNSKKLG